jgi:hypothetical protein
VRSSRRAGSSPRRRVAAVGIAAVFLAGFGAGTCRAAARPPRACAERVAHDYAKPFERMPPEHPPPEGELPFGPRNLAMYHAELGTQVVLPGHRLGYWFAAKDEGRRVLHLHWVVDAVLWRVDVDGRERAVEGSLRKSLLDVEDLKELELAFPARPVGLYRIDLRFDSLAGRHLASYREYFRVVAKKVGVRLVLPRLSFRPGEVVYAQARNFGTEGVSVPGVLPVQRWTGSAWSAVERPSSSITERVPWWLGSGEAAPCSRFAVPPDADPGRYRFRASVRILGGKRRRLLTSEFRVSGAAAAGSESGTG